MRATVNRVLSFVTFGALSILAAFLVIETGGALAGRDTPIGPVDYRSTWTAMDDWDPSTALEGAIFAAVMFAGLALIIFELRRRNDVASTTIADSPQGTVNLERRSLHRYLKLRSQEHDWIGKSHPRVDVTGTGVVVRDRPTTTRAPDEGDVVRLKEQLAEDLVRVGLDPQRVEIEPRAPSGHRQRSVR